MKFTCSTLPSDLPSWCSCSKAEGVDLFKCHVNYEDESLLETLEGDYDSSMTINELLESLGFGGTKPIVSRFRVKEDCYLAGLNKIFPVSIPFVSLFPSVVLMYKPCFVIDSKGFSNRRKQQIDSIYGADAVPVNLMAAMVTRNLACVPCDLVLVEEFE